VWAGLVEKHGAVPENTVVHATGLGTDGNEWGPFSFGGKKCMHYAFNLSTDVVQWPSHCVTAVQEGGFEQPKMPLQWLADIYGEDFDQGARVMEFPEVHDAAPATAQEAADFERRKAAGRGVFANGAKFQLPGFPETDWFEVSGTTEHVIVPVFINGDLMDKRRHMRRTDGNQAYISNWLSWSHRFERFRAHQPPAHEPGQFVSDAHVHLFEDYVAYWRAQGWLDDAQYKLMVDRLVSVTGGKVHVADAGAFQRLPAQQLGMVAESAHAISSNASKRFVATVRDQTTVVGVSREVLNHLLTCVEMPPGFSRTAHLQLLGTRGKHKMSKGDTMVFAILSAAWHMLRSMPRTASVVRAVRIVVTLRSLVHFAFNRMWYAVSAAERTCVSSAFRVLWTKLHELAQEEWPWLFSPNSKAIENCFLTSILVVPVARLQDCRAIEALHVPFMLVRVWLCGWGGVWLCAGEPHRVRLRKVAEGGHAAAHGPRRHSTLL